MCTGFYSTCLCAHSNAGLSWNHNSIFKAVLLEHISILTFRISPSSPVSHTMNNDQNTVAPSSEKFEQLYASMTSVLGSKKVKVYREGERACEFVVPVLRNSTTMSFNDGTSKCRIVRTCTPLAWRLESCGGDYNVKLEAQVVSVGCVCVEGTVLGDIYIRLNRWREVEVIVQDVIVGQLKVSTDNICRLRVAACVLDLLDSPTRTYLQTMLIYLFSQFPDSVTSPSSVPATLITVKGTAMLATVPAAAVVWYLRGIVPNYSPIPSS